MIMIKSKLDFKMPYLDILRLDMLLKYDKAAIGENYQFQIGRKDSICHYCQNNQEILSFKDWGCRNKCKWGYRNK